MLLKSSECSTETSPPLTSRPKTFRCGPYSLPLGEKTYLMGVLNMTRDSFSGDGLLNGAGAFKAVPASLDLAGRMLRAGADFLDIGGVSSRPGAGVISEQEELDRVIPVVRALVKELNVPLSIDTCRASVAEEALKEGASLINDITGLTGDERMASVIAAYRASVVIMHMRGTPQTMQRAPFYRDTIGEINSFFQNQLKAARSAGIAGERILLDPGIGFGKTVEHNLEILRSLDVFKTSGYPLLIGTSRKSFIGKLLNEKPAGERLFGTAATVALAVANGADVVRVHDVKEMKDVVRIADAIARRPPHPSLLQNDPSTLVRLTLSGTNGIAHHRSGFRPAGERKGAAGMPAGLHTKERET